MSNKVERFDLTKASDVIELADRVTRISYWKKFFRDMNADVSDPYQVFWEYVKSYVDEGMTIVTIESEEYVTFSTH